MAHSGVQTQTDSVSEEVCAVCGGALQAGAVVRLRNSCLRECGSCGSWNYLPRGGAAEQAALHDNAEYFDHPYFALRREVTPAQRRRCREVFGRMSVGLDVAALRGERILDIGCDTGVFLKAAQEECGVVPFGIDVAERAVEVARARGIQVWRAAVEDAPPELGEFPVITAIDLLEHVPDPHAFLRAVWSRLRPGGVLYLETPNICSAVFRFGRLLSLLTAGRPASLLERLFPPQHIQLFTPGSLRALAERTEFEVLDLRSRILPSPDIAASAAARLAIGTLQLFDRLQGAQILICAVLRRPGGKL